MLLQSIKNLFIVRHDCYPQQLELKNEYIVTKTKLTDDILKKHLEGTITIGCWQTEPITKKVKWVCFDFDGILEEEYEKAKKLFYKLVAMGFNPLLEFSGRRGYHVWLFVEPVDMAVARQFVAGLSKGVSDVYPKSDKIENGGYGFQVKLPLGIHRMSMKRSFVFDNNLKPLSQRQGELFLISFSEKKRDVISLTNIESFIK
jgi:hypothetical protein